MQRMTKQRSAIFDLLHKEAGFLSAQEVYENPELRAFFHEPGKKLLVNYVQLSDVNKKKVISYSENLLKIQQMEEEQLHLIPDAAHDRTDVETTDDMKQNDDAIMENNSFWKK